MLERGEQFVRAVEVVYLVEIDAVRTQSRERGIDGGLRIRDVTVHREEVYDAIRREAAPDPKA